MNKDKAPSVLVILDGFGYSKDSFSNAIYHAQKPTFDFLLKTFPHTLLDASGTAVGLPANTIGNSEVGHLTLGAGRIIQQPLTLISNEIREGTLQKNPILTNNFLELQKNKGNLHLMGLLSDSGVHSTIEHLFGYLEIAKKYDLANVFIHCFLDGRDVPPHSANHYLSELNKKIDELKIGTIASLHGRFYAMDRDHNWQRTQSCYNVLTQKQEITFDSWNKVVDYYYQRQIFDEFIPPTQLLKGSIIKKDDGILFFNIRPDRARQLTQAFTDPEFNFFERSPITLSFFITPISYNDRCITTPLLEQKVVHNSLLECLSKSGKSIYAIAETEKYAHITYFFSGGREQPWPHEMRMVVPSLPLRNYVQHPEMSADLITKQIIDSLEHDPFDFYLINYANADMVGHSGDFNATIRAVECLDGQLGALYQEVVVKRNGTLYITADHGNAEKKFDVKTGQPSKSHTTNPVYLIMAKKGLENKQFSANLEGLSDVAPFILNNMHISVPSEMQHI